MKKTLVLCAAACSTGLWLMPVAAVVAATADHRFLSSGGKRLRLRKVVAHEVPGAGSMLRLEGPLDDIMAREKAQKAAKIAAAAAAKAAAEAARLAAMPVPAPAPAPMPAPAPAPLPAPAPMPDPPPPIPPCNWTYDWEDIARPADCTNMTDVNWTIFQNHTCERSANLTFEDNITISGCVPPPVARCENPTRNGQFPTDYDENGNVVALYAIPGLDEDTIKHGEEFDVVCVDGNATAFDHRYVLESEAQDWYPGITRVTGVCNNGTIMRMNPTNMTFWEGHPYYKPAGIIPKDLRCVLKQKVDLTQDVVSYLRWSEPRMQEAETRGYKWIDMDAILHKTLLKNAMEESARIEMDARDMGELTDLVRLKRVIKALVDNRMIPRGEEINQATCKDLESHWLYQLKNSDPFKKANNIGYANWVPPVDQTIGFPLKDDIKLERPIDFTCSYTAHKAAVGADPYSRVMNYRYRDGCFCESRWVGGCPFRAELKPNFQTFGFDTAEVKMVSTSPGAPTNALCWYFSKPANPEWGYLRTDTGYAYQAPAQNVTELKRDWIKLRKIAQAARFKRR